MDPKANYQFVVTLDNEGAAVERIELVDQTSPGQFKHRSLHSKERDGYLGYLALVESTSSLDVNSVPQGSPAATAKCKENPDLVGLRPGDKIIGWDGLSGFPSSYKLDKRLSNHSAGQTIELKILRDGASNDEMRQDDPEKSEVNSDAQVKELDAAAADRKSVV